MRALMCSIIGLTLLAATVSAQTRSTWVTLAPKGAGFSVSLPAKPASLTINRPTYTMHMFTVKVGNTAFSVGYGDMGPDDPDLKAGLIATRDKMIESLRGRLTSSREITVDGQTGIDFTAETVVGNMRSQFFLIGNRMIQTIVFIKGEKDTRNINRFFNSFRFTN